MAEVYLIVVICSREREGFRPVLLKHFFQHYFACGFKPQNCYATIMIDGCSPSPAPFLKSLGINITNEVTSIKYAPFEYTQERQFLQKALPRDAWFVNPELEEFIAFPKPISQLAKEMEKAGYNCLSGWLWDRFNSDFKLAEIHPEHPLHLQFPLSVEYTSKVLFANTRKEVLAKNHFVIQGGGHCIKADSDDLFSAPASWHIRVDSYKWTDGARARVERLYELHSSQAGGDAIAKKYQRLLKAIQKSEKEDIITNDVPLRTTIHFPKAASAKLRFVHIPKTAGTTITDVINHWFPGVQRINSWNSLSTAERALLNEEQIICGHIPLRYLSIDNDKTARWFTVLRDPIEQAISCYYEAAKNIAHRSPELQDLIEEGLESLLLSGKFGEIWTGSTRFLSSLPKESSIEQSFESAKRNLHSFTAIGFYENLDAFVTRMAAILNQEPPEKLPWENKNSYKPAQINLSPRAKSVLEQITFYDRELYNYAQQLTFP